MGLSPSKVNPEAYRVPLQSALDGSSDQEIGERLKQHGFVIFRLNEDMHKHVATFFSQGKEFFALPAEEKRKYLAEQDPIRNAVRKRNEGYVDASDLKEYLKFLEKDVATGALPPVLAEELTFIYSWFERLGEVAVRSVARALVPDGQSFWSQKTYEVVNANWKRKSSLAFIHYYAINEELNEQHNKQQAEGPSGINSGIAPDQALPSEDPFNDKAYHFPSEVHTDTGLMTFIFSTNIPGLQVVTQEDNPRWLEVERVFEPFMDLVLITGRKSALFAQSEPAAIRPCVHRVAIPLNSERYSLLFFLDVPQ